MLLSALKGVRLGPRPQRGPQRRTSAQRAGRRVRRRRCDVRVSKILLYSLRPQRDLSSIHGMLFWDVHMCSWSTSIRIFSRTFSERIGTF